MGSTKLFSSKNRTVFLTKEWTGGNRGWDGNGYAMTKTRANLALMYHSLNLCLKQQWNRDCKD